MSDRKQLQRVSDVVPRSGGMEGDLIYVRGLVDEEFVITGIAKRTGESGDYLAVDIEWNGRKCFLFTSHQALVPKLLKCQEHLPLLATIRQVKSEKLGRTYFDIE